MKLVLAEKPSVAQSIAKVLGAEKRRDGYLEGNGYVVSWCVGHLVELAQPEEYDIRYAKWSYDDLPILPSAWRYNVLAATQKQFAVLNQLMKREDIESLVCATDAGREGELIFRLVYHQCHCQKPFERLWISSMEDSAIKDGFANLKPSTEYDALYEAALCRERADWIVGINATRLFSCLYKQTLNVGRVMTPTLGMAVMREAAIAAFQSEPFYTVELHCPGFCAVSERMKEKDSAEILKSRCENSKKAIVIRSEQKKQKENPPALYDLTTLQREANRVFGFTAQQTLDYIQSLYEKKLVTYPRTDSRYLTVEMEGNLPRLLQLVAEKYELPGEYCVNVSQVINGKKVSDHHAILPTQSMQKVALESLPAGEQEVLKLITARLLCAVAEPCLYAETIIELDCNGVIFSAKGKRILQDGWKGIQQLFYPEKKSKDNCDLPDLGEGETIAISDVCLKEGKTTPPKHFTEDTLLQAMENAGADEMTEEAERKGIGTPSTRAAIIEKLVRTGFLERKGDKKAKHLIPTDKGVALITVLPEQIQSPAMTADWEDKLARMERNEYSSNAFMQEIEEMIKELVKTYEIVKGADVIMSKNKVAGHCPHCNCEVIECQKGWFCSNKECQFVLWRDNRFFQSIGKKLTVQTVSKLLRDGRAHLKECKSKKTGKIYSTDILLSTEPDGKVKFQMEFENGGKR